MSIRKEQGDTFRRLAWPRLAEHHVNVVVFSVLVVTGMAQRYHEATWAAWTIEHMGGIDAVRISHRYFGLAFGGLLLVHLAIGAYFLVVRRSRPTMVINGRDFKNAIENLRYYFGMAPNPARCDRFDYKQKFEYWGVLMGGILMLTTGLMLWFPTTILSALPFLPGELIPAAKVAHSNEAMLAFLIIAVWHIYNAIFSPEVFPFDTVILHGRISKKRMMHEHPLEYERLMQDDEPT